MLRVHILSLSLLSCAVFSMGSPICGSSGSKSMAAAASELYNSIAATKAEEGEPNFVFSPFSILSAFQVAQLGARGATREEMEGHFPSSSRIELPALRGAPDAWGALPLMELETANRMYVESSSASDEQFGHFAQQVSERLNCDAVPTDFEDSAAAAAAINAFVEGKTKGHIKHIVPASALTPSSRMVLVNALYFKAPWASPFSPHRTATGPFYVNDTRTGRSEVQQVKFMQQRLEEDFGLFESDKVKALSLPYADPRCRLYLFLPNSIAAFEQELQQKPETTEELVSLVDNTPSSDVVLDLSLPLIKLAAERNQVGLVDVYKRLGVQLMFDEDKADFSGISGSRKLFVSSFLHQADMQWDEEGTEAAAATALMVAGTAALLPKQEKVLVANVPFLFQLRFKEDAGSHPVVLLAGRVIDAKAAQ